MRGLKTRRLNTYDFKCEIVLLIDPNEAIKDFISLNGRNRNLKIKLPVVNVH